MGFKVTVLYPKAEEVGEERKYFFKDYFYWSYGCSYNQYSYRLTISAEISFKLKVAIDGLLKCDAVLICHKNAKGSTFFLRAVEEGNA